MAKIYVASSWRNPWQPTVVQEVREAGHDAYNFRQPTPGDHGFHWSDVDGGWQRWTPKEYRAALGHPIAEAGFAADMDALQSCDACLLVQPCGVSSHLELGWACGAGKTTAVLFPVDIDPAPIDGHSVSEAPCPACGDSDGCHLPERLNRIEPELMTKMASDMLLSRVELYAWLSECP